MSEYITKLNILSQDGTIFDTDVKYVIPLYQRAFAWEEKQLTQLIEDINDVADDANYYMGTLIVSRQDNAYEVVDGQQRLTALFLLFNCLGIQVPHTLKFACRAKSNYTLEHIQDLLHDNRISLDMDAVEEGIRIGTEILQEKLQEINNEQNTLELFIEKLKRVVLYRIVVPEHTDLNRYFEIMNTRGEQLEQHDILKAMLMSYLNDTDKKIFAKIWEACSDMTGYVQMHFVSKNNVVRDKIFKSYWCDVPTSDWSEYMTIFETEEPQPEQWQIKEIIRHNTVIEDEGYLDDDVRVRFDSVIEFPYFLLHTIKVLVTINNISHKDVHKKLLDELPLDDKKLLENYTRVIAHGVYKGQLINSSPKHKATFAKLFISCLLRTRYLFDRCIIKREYANDDQEGEWSLKTLVASRLQSRSRVKVPLYQNSWIVWYRAQGKTNNKRVRDNIQLQSALRVSYTSPKVMHWITKLLIWLSEEDCKHYNEDIDAYNDIIENIAIEAVRRDFLENEDCITNNYAMGVNTPHIVFNYLDYLIWYYNDDERYKDFKFEFRNSVEHWYPQHPSEGTFEEWKDGVDQFGNLCLVQRNINSRFSNMSPEAKKTTYRDMISKGSLKLRLMSDLTEKNGDQPANLYWKETLCKKHGDDMLQMLRDACENRETVEEDSI